MNNATLIGFIFLIISFFGLGLCFGSNEIKATIDNHCEKIAESKEFNSVFDSIEDCQVKLSVGW